MKDPFQRLAIPRTFALDRKVLDKNHRELSRALHPDRYVAAPPAERKRALSEAADVNEAFRIVRDPIRRAEALFALEGVAVGEANEPKPPASFLMEMMELREEVEEARSSGDRARLERIRATVDASLARVEARIAALFTGAEEVPRTLLDDAVHLLGEYRFYARARETLVEIDDADSGG